MTTGRNERLPGFTADTSIYPTSHSYQTGRYGSRPTTAGGHYEDLQATGVFPQLMRIDWGCVDRCEGAGHPWGWCTFSCTEPVEGGGGGDIGSRPYCTHCLRGWKVCITRDGDIRRIRCQGLIGF